LGENNYAEKLVVNFPADLMEIRKRFNELYPDKIAFLSGGDPALVERLKNELTNLKNQESNENSVSV
jgi:hypothetical protein